MRGGYIRFYRFIGAFSVPGTVLHMNYPIMCTDSKGWAVLFLQPADKEMETEHPQHLTRVSGSQGFQSQPHQQCLNIILQF